MSLIKVDVPFSVGTTSYIINNKKDNLIANINYLKDKVEKIQLLLFGKNYLEELINDECIFRLSEIKKASNISYTVHLPIDLDLMNDDKAVVDNSIEVIKYIFKKIDILDINEYIIHLDRSDNFKYEEIKLDEKSYKKFEYVLSVLKKNFKNDYKKILIENTGYDLTYFKDLIFNHGFNVCMDIGHIYINDFNFKFFINSFNEKIKEIHLHGFVNKKDHLSLKKVNKEILFDIFKYLKTYKESLIIEVFNKKNLIESVKVINKNFRLTVKDFTMALS